MRRILEHQLPIFLFLVTTFCNAQTSQFLFDDNGNLAVQVPESVAPPQIIGQPQNQLVSVGEAAAFSVIVANPKALTYQWRFNGVDIGSATNEALILQNVSTNNEGAYDVVLTNPSGSVTSAPAMLWIDSRGVGMPDSWQLAFFGNLSQLPNRDFDGDGSSNLQEFLDGSDPTDPNSVRYRLTVVREGGSVVRVPDQVSYTNGQTVTLTATASSNELFHAWLGDALSRDNPLAVVMTSNKTVYARFTPIAFTWTNLANGNWETATNWTPNLVPGVNDTVFIPSSVAVTLNTNADCADVTLGGLGSPTLTGSGALTVRENLFWTAGTMSLSGTLLVQGNFLWMAGIMSGGGRTILETNAWLSLGSVSLFTRTLENRGTVLLTGAFDLANGPIITNCAGALFDVRNAVTIGGGNISARIDNAGTFRKSVNSGTATVNGSSSSMSFNNYGVVEIQSGTLQCFVPFTNHGAVTLSPGTTNRLASGGAGAGTFDAPASALVEWSGGAFTLNAGAQLNGVGLYRINSFTTVTANTDLLIENLDLSGTLSGSGAVTILGAMTWTAGTMSGSGRTILETNASLSLSSANSVLLGSRTLENRGTILLTGAAPFDLANGAIITNCAAALFHVRNAVTIGGGNISARIDNAGTFRKSVNSGTATVSGSSSSMSFNNYGVVEIQSGTLQCFVPFTNHGAVTLSPGTTNRLAFGGAGGGTFDAPTSALVEWTGGSYTLSSGAQLNGAGLYRLNGSTLTANPNLTVENLDLVHASSTLGGTGVITIAGAMNWTAGTMSGSGRTIIPAGVLLNLALSSSASLGTRTLENGGTVLWTGAVFGVNSGGVITNRPGALFRAEGEAANGLGGGAASGRFDNAGTFRKSAGTGTTTVASGMKFTNYNTVDIRSGKLAANGGYVSASNALLNCALGGTTAGTNYGQLQVAGTVTLNGGLSVDLLPGFSPATNDTFTVLTAGTRSNTFSSFSYPSNRVTMSLSNSPNSVILRVTDVLPIPQPVLLTPQLVGSNALLTWTATSNVTYRLESNPNLGSNWSAVPGDVTTLSNTASKLDALTLSNRFYRVRVLP